MDQYSDTNSLAFAAYLVSLGYVIDDITTRSAESPLFFRFMLDKVEYDQFAQQFWSRKTDVDALTYFEAVKNLKSRIYLYKDQKIEYEKERKTR